MAILAITDVANPTGEQLAHEIRTRAAQLGVTLGEFMRPISAQPHAWLNQLDRARQPKRRTVIRVRALITGSSVLPPPANFPGQPPRTSPPHIAQHQYADHKLPEPVNRDPCFSCGVRAEAHATLGCGQWTRP